MEEYDWESFWIGVVLTVFVWWAAANLIEISKIRNGYLTHKNKTYTVRLYDSLDKPENVEIK